MTDEEILQKMRERIGRNLNYGMESSGDSWLNMAPIFLQLQIIDKLSDIGADLIDIHSLLDSIDTNLIKIRNSE